MLGHLGLEVADLAAATPYYDDVLGLLGHERWDRPGDLLAYRPAGGRPGTTVFVYPAVVHAPPRPAGAPGLGHLAFTVPTRQLVHDVHARVVAHGRPVVHLPRAFPEYPPPYFATFWVDPSGVVLEAVCHRV